MIPYPNLDNASAVVSAWYRDFSPNFPDIWVEYARINEETQEVEVSWGYVVDKPFCRIRISFEEWEKFFPEPRKAGNPKIEAPTDWSGAVVRTGACYKEVLEDRGAVILTRTIYSQVEIERFKRSVTFVHPDIKDWQPEESPELTPLQKAYQRAYYRNPGKVDPRAFIK